MILLREAGLLEAEGQVHLTKQAKQVTPVSDNPISTGGDRLRGLRPYWVGGREIN